jgi:hypothetical protein
MSLLFDRLSAKGVFLRGKGMLFPEAKNASAYDAHIFDIQNVADYYHQFIHTDSRSWVWNDFPNVAPPFNNFWMEFKVKSAHFGGDPSGPSSPVPVGLAVAALDFSGVPGVPAGNIREVFTRLLQGEQVDFWGDGSSPDPHTWRTDRVNAVWSYLIRGAGRRKVDIPQTTAMACSLYGLVPVRWEVAITVFFEVASTIYPLAHFTSYVTPDGRVYGFDNRQAIGIRYFHDDMEGVGDDVMSNVVGPGLLALSFLHCKNVTAIKQTPPKKLSKATQKRHGKPLVRYHTLEIEPMKQVLKHEGQVEKTGLKKALHICRGHFAHYSEEKPLFGRIAGTVWRPSHVRGSLDEGVVGKDYRVKEPKHELV